MSETKYGFEVDTQLFRELGELLVGRDSTALAELVKNSYDADATEVFVYGENLKNPLEGTIVVRDNGVGMTPEEFQSGFLTIASRSKGSHETRQSPILKRNVTGSKGIGRLAAHKLAAHLQIESLPHSIKQSRLGIRAKINWNAIESLTSLSEVMDSNAIEIETFQLPENYVPGTTITLKHLRRTWSDSDINAFTRQMVSYQAPPGLTQDNSSELGYESIIGTLPGWTIDEKTGMAILLEGAFDTGDTYGTSRISQAEWVIEIASDLNGVKYKIAELPKQIPTWRKHYEREFSLPRESFPNCPTFKSRIFFKKGVNAWDNGGVGLYMEGFRVFPYGEPGNDWLDVAKRYAERTTSISLPSLLGNDRNTSHFMRFPSERFFGGVFLTVDSSTDLQMLVNREGFVSNDSFSELLTAVKTGVELLVRALSETFHQDEQGKINEKIASIPGKKEKPEPLQVRVEKIVERAVQTAEESRSHLAKGNLEDASTSAQTATEHLLTAIELSKDLMDEHRLIAVLAGIGTHLLAFTHDIRQLIAELNVLDDTLAELLDQPNLQESFRSKASRSLNRLRETRRLVEHQSLHLADLVSNDARRRRTRLSLSDQFQKAEKFLDGAIVQHVISVQNDLNKNLETPPMFRSELSVVMANILSNAIKACGDGGKIWVYGQETPTFIELILENTGRSVDLVTGSQLFEPFVSTSVDIDQDLGQGTGLGLTIVKRILERNEATAEFIAPSTGFSTAIKLRWRRR